MKYSPVMKKVDLTAQADRLREDALALVEEEEWDFQSRVMDVVRQAKRERVQIILLSGPTSSGKTTASRILSDGLSQDGSRSGRISLDDFYKNRDQAPLWEDGSKNFESIEGLDLEAFGSCLDTLFTTGRAQVPIFDFTTGTRSPLTQELTFDDDTCLIFEGLHAINPHLTPLLGKYRTMRIYISLHSDYVDHQGNLLLDGRSVRLLRRLLRDRVRRGSGADETLMLWDYVLRGEELYMHPYRPLADVHINSAHSYEPFLYTKEGARMLRAVKPDSKHRDQVERIIHALDDLPYLPWSAVPRKSLLQEFICMR